MSEQYECPICGFLLDFEPWHEYPSHDAASDEFCPCCGMQFGNYDFVDKSRRSRHRIHNEWREEWIKNGLRWESPELPPFDLDPVAQMRRSSRATDDSVNTAWRPRRIHPAISTIVAEAGCRSVWQWLQQWPIRHYSDIIKECGNLTVGHLVIAEFAEAVDVGKFVNAAKDALVRELWLQCQAGWGGDDDRSRLNRISSHANWLGLLRWGIWTPDSATQSKQPYQTFPIWKALEELNPPPDWLPQSIDDELLTNAFEHWPEP